MRVLAFSSALVLAALSPAASKSAGLPLDRTKSLEQILADCDPTTGLPHGVGPPTSSGGERHQRVVINPNWLRRPSATDIANAYPPDARASRISGHTIIKCIVGLNGETHDCQIAAEDPPGKGFGDAGLKLAKLMLFIPRRIDCVAADGASVSIPFGFGPQPTGNAG
jgi:protein TonB